MAWVQEFKAKKQRKLNASILRMDTVSKEPL